MTELQTRLIHTLAQSLRVPAAGLTRQTHFRNDLNLDSLHIMDLIVILEDEFGVPIPDQQIPRLLTLGDLFDFLERKLPGRA